MNQKGVRVRRADGFLRAAERILLPCTVFGLFLFSAISTSAQFNTNNFFNWETPPVHPVALSPDGATLAVCNLPDDHLELFDVSSGVPVSLASIPVGLNPVSACFRTTNELWVANYISGTISVIDIPTLRVFNTVSTSNQPSDIVFAGTPQRAYVSCGQPNLVQVFDPVTTQLVTNLVIDGNRPRAMTVSPDGNTVYVAIFESGNATTVISTGTASLTNFPRPSPITFPSAPSHGLDPPPNSGTNFVPAINPALTNPPPQTSLIVKKNAAGRWMDDNNGDWTDFISGSKAAFTGRIPGWDMPDHDLAVINTTNLSLSYACGLMNICMAVAVNPASGKISVIGTDALNNLRFQSVLDGIFIRVEMAQVDPASLTNQVFDFNPHLNYLVPQISTPLRQMSIGDPRGIVWSSDGTTAYVTGMGSDNLIIINAQGNRTGINPTIAVGKGPTGLVLDEPRHRLYIYNRFDGSISTVDTISQSVVVTQPLFDPTPQVIKVGRPHLYSTFLNSGLGQLACASCHVDARFDRLAWDLGEPTSTMTVIDSTYNFANSVPPFTNNYHPMKGPMTTQTLQDIIGHEPFHWRGDREGIEAFNQTFTNLQGAVNALATNEMSDFKSFLATVRFPPNPYRQIDNSLPANLPIPGFFALGRGALPAGTQLPNGNAVSGMTAFRQITTPDCIVCHTLPVGIGTDRHFTNGQWVSLPVSTNNSHHAAIIELDRSDGLPFKIPQLRNLADKLGMDFNHTNSRSGFGFSHDGGVDSLVRFLQDGLSFTNDQQTADMVAFLLSFPGSDLPAGLVTDINRSPGLPSLDTPAGVGRQVTINNSNSVPLINTMIKMAATPSNRVDLIVKGVLNGVARGWLFDTNSKAFISDRNELLTTNALSALAAVGSEQTYTLVPSGAGRRMAIDRDLDGQLDGQVFLQSFNLSTNGTVINSSSAIGMVYQLEYKSSLTDSNWTTILGIVAGTGNAITFSDNGSGTNGARFYRIVATP